ncbi:MAG: PEGA domain-containing protein, partial [Fibromonadaceae bacterium]|nr:PEGA domain-containing protein [Fibromonadaceae bacterium]
RLGRFGGNLTISVELYNSATGLQVSTTISGEAKEVYGLLAVLNEKAPRMFSKLPGVSNGKTYPPAVVGGISGIQTADEGYELNEGKRYLVNLNTEPLGAVLSFDGVPSTSCTKTPCKLELAEGNVRIVAVLEQYERADTTVFIKQNNQNIIIKLKPNFGFLEIKPAYLEEIGKDEQWSLTINGKAISSWENKLSPNKYKVELSHRCYEALSFEVGINKGKNEIFDMAKHIKLKKGGLILSAEMDGEPVSEPVFVNGKQVGETPFNGAVPLCAKVEIGKNKKIVDVKLKYNEKVEHKFKGISASLAKDIDKVLKNVADLQTSGKTELGGRKNVAGIQTSGKTELDDRSNSFTDSRDGKKYRTVMIGTQTWMAENLNYNANSSKCYENKPANCEKYGRLYNWNTAKMACPKGWHLPSDNEWQTLVNFAGGNGIAGKNLKAKNGWNSNGNGEDAFGFSALPGGYSSSGGSFGSIGYDGNWWSSSEYKGNNAYNRYMYYSYEKVSYSDGVKSSLQSVRCLQD